MQYSPNEIKDRLLNALDAEYNVVDRPAALQAIGLLKGTEITKEALETTRLGKYINELRKKTQDQLIAKNAKSLLRLWRKLLLPNDTCQERHSTAGPGSGLPSGLGPGPSERRNVPSANSPSVQNHSRFNSCSPSTSWASGSPEASCNNSIFVNHAGSKPATPNSFAQNFRGGTPKNLSNYKQPVFSPARNHTNQHHGLDSAGSSGSTTVSPKISKRPSSQSEVPAISPNNVSINRHSINVDLVSKTNMANKRLRKDESGFSEGLSRSKRPALANNISPPMGVYENGFDGGESNDSIRSFHESSKKTVIKACSSNEVPDSMDSGIASKMKKRKANSQQGLNDLKNKIAAAHARTKVKTTAQLIEELKAKNNSLASNPAISFPSISNQSKLYSHSPNASPSFSRRSVNLKSTDEEMTKNKTDLMDKFLKDSARSTIDYAVARSSSADLTSSSKSRVYDKEPKVCLPEVDPVDEILAQLPPINYDEIVWDDDDDYAGITKSELIVNDDVVNRIHSENWEGMNGNIDHTGEFKEWHETFSRESYQGDLLNILPYVNIN